MSIQIQRNGTWQEVSKQEFLGLVNTGVIRPDTAVIINDQQIVAARIKGLVFPGSGTVPPPRPVDPETVSDAGFFDVKFTRFITTHLISLLWIISIVSVIIGVVSCVILGLMSGDTTTSGVSLFIAISLPFSLLYTRILFECIIIGFRIEKHLRTIRDQLTKPPAR